MTAGIEAETGFAVDFLEYSLSSRAQLVKSVMADDP